MSQQPFRIPRYELNFFLKRPAEPVKEIHRALDQLFAAGSSDTNLLVICHSQGGFHLSNALLSYSKKLRERVLAIGFASAKYIYRETCRDITHYRATIVYRFLGTKRHKSIGIKGFFNDNDAMSESSLTCPRSG